MNYPTYEALEDWTNLNKNKKFHHYCTYEKKHLIFIPEYVDITMDEIKRKTGYGDYAVFGTTPEGEYVSVEDTDIVKLRPVYTDEDFLKEIEDL